MSTSIQTIDEIMSTFTSMMQWADNNETISHFEAYYGMPHQHRKVDKDQYLRLRSELTNLVNTLVTKQDAESAWKAYKHRAHRLDRSNSVYNLTKPDDDDFVVQLEMTADSSAKRLLKLSMKELVDYVNLLNMDKSE